MKCADCRWYAPAPMEANDRCQHEKATHRIGGIREDATEGYFTCVIMLDSFCAGHKLFEEKESTLAFER